MTQPSIPLEIVLLDWLRQATDITPESLAPGVWEVAPGPGLPGLPVNIDQQGRAIIAMNPLSWGSYPGAELVGTSHPLIDYARDHLSREGNLAVAEAWLPAVITDAKGRMALPGVTIEPPPKSVKVQTTWKSVLILTWLARYEADERAEFTFKMLVDAGTGRANPNLVLGSWVDGLRDGRPKGVSRPSITEALLAARQEAEQRIRNDLSAFAKGLDARLAKDCELIKTHLNAKIDELRGNDQKGRSELNQWAENQIEDVRRKLACRGYLNLQSAVLAWLPVLGLRLEVPGKKRSVESCEFGWSVTGGTRAPACTQCGKSKVFRPCVPGQHLYCSCSASKPCAECGEPGCTEHIAACGSCGRIVCSEHRGSCDYEMHSSPICRRCLRPSVDGRPICPECANECSQCGNLFDAFRIALCRGGEPVCIDSPSEPCGRECQECSQIVCSAHGVETAEGTRVCLDHAVESDCCDRTFAHSRVLACTVCGEALCPEHRYPCAGCGKMVCKEHSRAAWGRGCQRVCDKCAEHCASCPPDRAWVRNDLAVCSTCGAMLCSEHSVVCSVCQKPHCLTHLMRARDGSLLCQHHREACAHCPPENNLHKAPLQKCAVCGKRICPSHDKVCPTCGMQHYGSTHRLPTCLGCGQTSCGVNGCSHNSDLCDGCQLTYCRHCGSAMGRNGKHTALYATTGKFCTTCASLAPLSLSPEWLKWLQNVALELAQEEQDILKEILNQAKHLHLFSAKQRGGTVIALRALRPWYKFWEKNLSGSVLWLRQDASGAVAGHIMPWEEQV